METMRAKLRPLVKPSRLHPLGSPLASTGSRTRLRPSFACSPSNATSIQRSSLRRVSSRVRTRIHHARSNSHQLAEMFEQPLFSRNLRVGKAPARTVPSRMQPEKEVKVLPQWREGEVIGQGSEGVVRKAMDAVTGRLFAVKKFYAKGACTDLTGKLHQEVPLLQQLQHPHVVQYIGGEYVENTYCLFLEYMSGGSVKSLIERIGPLPEPTAKLYTRQLLQGLQYLHTSQVIHRDIKAANLLLTEDGQLKLSDFGCAKKYQDVTESGFVNTIKGSLAWTAPEVVLQQGYGRKSDVWSVGCVVLEMLSGVPPWEASTDYIALLLKLAKTQEVPEIPATVSDVAREFITQCLNRDYDGRPAVSQLLTHPFIN